MKYIFFLVIFFVSSFFLVSQEIDYKVVAQDLDTPWEILWGPDNHIWMTERYGRISRVNPDNGVVSELIKINEVFEDGERGLMGMVLHPEFTQNPFVYVVFNTGSTNQNTRIKVVRYNYSGNSLNQPITLIDSIQGWWNHNGSRLWISPDNKLFVTIGDAANTSTAQNLNSLNGKILRMNLDGSIPEDNPYQNSYIYSFGHRNPQGLVYAMGKLYSSEHGASTNDEINIIYKGRNYGWPNVEGYCDTQTEKQFCSQNNIVEPILSLTPTSTLAVAGIDFYNHNLIPEWKNSLLVTTLKASKFLVLKLNSNGDSILLQNEFFAGTFGRLRDICISDDGRVFISTSNKDGRGNIKPNDDKIIEIQKKNSSIREPKQLSFIYPNPNSGNFNIDNNIFEEKNNLIITDLIGRELINLKNIESNNINLNHNFKNGIYYIIFRNSKNTFIDKLIINN